MEVVCVARASGLEENQSHRELMNEGVWTFEFCIMIWVIFSTTRILKPLVVCHTLEDFWTFSLIKSA